MPASFLGIELTFWGITLGVISFIIAFWIVERSKWPTWTGIPLGFVVAWTLPWAWSLTFWLLKVIIILGLCLGVISILKGYASKKPV